MEIKNLLKLIFDLTHEKRYPDIHLNTWSFPIIRNNNWELERLENIEIVKKEFVNENWETIKETEKIEFNKLTKEEISQAIKIIAWTEWYEKFTKNFELDTSYKHENKDNYRVNCYIDTAWYSIALRIIPTKIPTIEDLWLGESIKELCQKEKWLILVTWPTWSWKSTNLAAMIDYINKNYKKHIITIEDPVEFVFESEKSLINQREIWNHTFSFNDAIRASLREDPDIIMVWEMRDLETIKAAITLAETWHLVLSTLHTNDSVQSVDRIIDSFPASQQDQIRMQFAMSLIWIISQRLLPRSNWNWRIPAREILISNDAVRNLIITWKTHQLYSVIEVSSKSWMILMDKYLTLLYQKWVIDKETLFSCARDREWIEMLINE